MVFLTVGLVATLITLMPFLPRELRELISYLVADLIQGEQVSSFMMVLACRSSKD